MTIRDFVWLMIGWWCSVALNVFILPSLGVHW